MGAVCVSPSKSMPPGELLIQRVVVVLALWMSRGRGDPAELFYLRLALPGSRGL